MRGQFWFSFFRGKFWFLVFGNKMSILFFFRWVVNFGLVFEMRGQFCWWQSGQTFRDGAVKCQQKNLISGKVCKYLWAHLDPIHLWMMQVWWPDQLLTFWKSLFFHIFRENRLMVKNQPIVMFVKASDAVSWPHALFGLCWPQPIRRWLWWCKLYFSDCRSVFLRWCISQILPGVFLRSCKLYIFLK